MSEIYIISSPDKTLMVKGFTPNESFERLRINNKCLLARRCLYLPNHSSQGQFLSGVKLFWIQSFLSKQVAITTVKEHSLPYYLPIAEGGGDIWMHTFPKSISSMRNVNHLIQDFNSCSCIHFTMIMIVMPQMTNILRPWNFFFFFFSFLVLFF